MQCCNACGPEGVEHVRVVANAPPEAALSLSALEVRKSRARAQTHANVRERIRGQIVLAHVPGTPKHHTTRHAPAPMDAGT